MILSPSEIAYLVRWVGFAPAEEQTAVAVALAESGGNCDVIARSTSGVNIGNRDHGLWQMSNRWNAERLATMGPWRSPWRNTLMAFDLFIEWDRAFTPWHVFTSGAFEVFMPDAAIALVRPFAPPGKAPPLPPA